MSDALLRAFLIVSRHESLTRAADSLGVSQPALSRRIRELEEHLGSKLFDRHGRGVRLTRIGETLLARLGSSFLEIDSAVEEVSQRREAGAGLIAIASVHTLNAYFIPPVLNTFRRGHPEARFRILGRSSEEVVELTRRGVVDLGIVYGALVLDEQVDIQHLFNEEIVVAYSNELDVAEELREGRLPQGLPLVTFPPGYALRALVDRVTIGLRRNIRCEAETLDALVSLVELGVGASFLPRPAIQDRISAGRLAATATLNALTRQVVLISRQGQTMSPLSCVLSQSLIAEAKRLRSASR